MGEVNQTSHGLRLISGTEINNGILGIPQISCMQQTMQFTFETEDVFSGRIYVKGRVNDADCSKKIVRDAGASDVTFVVPLGQCGMQRVRNFDPPGMNMMITVVISFHLIFVTKVDRAYRLQCLFRPTSGKMVTQTLDVSMLPTTPISSMGAISARCEYSIRRGNIDGPKLRFASVGEKAYHLWQCDAGSGNYGILVYGCEVNDSGSTETVNIVDNRGCTVDPVLIEPIQYDSQSARAWAVTHVFKYSDQSAISFQCDIKICSKDRDECQTTTPPDCSKDDSFMRRLGKSRKVRGAEGITVSLDSAPGLQLGVTTEEILVFDPNLLDYGLASQLEETFSFETNPRNHSAGTTIINENYSSTSLPSKTIDKTTKTHQSYHNGDVVSSYKLSPFGGFTVAGDQLDNTPNPATDPICVSHDMFAIMITSTLLSFTIATLFMALAFAKVIAHLCLQSRKPMDSISLRSASWSPQQLAIGTGLTRTRISPTSTCSSAWSRHALPPSWQQQPWHPERLSSYFATIHK